MKKINCILLCLAACAGLSGCGDLMETAPSNEVDKSLILKDVNAVKVAMNGVYSTMYNRIDFVTANAHQCFGNMAVTLCAEVMGDDMIQTAQGPGWFWKDYNYEARVRYTSKIWRSYFTWKYFYEIISNVNYILSVEHTAAGDENELKCVMAQAYAARAFAYFMLIQDYFLFHSLMNLAVVIVFHLHGCSRRAARRSARPSPRCRRCRCGSPY